MEHEQVATYTKVNRVDVEDIDGFMADLQLFMRYGVLNEVQELLVTALMTTSGIAVPDVSADGNTPDRLLSPVGQLTASGVQANFVALSPLDATAAFKEREAAEGAYVSGNRWAKLPPIGQSAALAPGTALTGDSRIAAALSVRQGVVVIVGTEAEDLRRNLLIVVLEGRWAPLVLVPAALAKVDLTTA